MQLEEILDPDLLAKHLREGTVVSQTHPELPLTIYNYSKTCQYKRAWDEVTTQTRGLVIDNKDRIILLPLPKFYNIAEHKAYEDELGPLPNERFSIYEKMDGSLFLARNDPEYGVVTASRGSFTSEQAQKGRELLPWYFDNNPFRNLTYIFEVIYPSNRIVVSYGDKEALYLLAARNANNVQPDESWKTLTELATILQVELPRKFTLSDDINALPDFISDEEEGYVIHFHPSGVRAKIKGDEYIRLHKIMTQATEKTVWEWLRDGKRVQDLVEDVPDEFYKWLEDTATKLQEEHNKILDIAAIRAVQARDQYDSRKEQALFLKDTEYPGISFSLLDGNESKASDAVWKMIKPKGDES